DCTDARCCPPGSQAGWIEEVNHWIATTLHHRSVHDLVRVTIHMEYKERRVNLFDWHIKKDRPAVFWVVAVHRVLTMSRDKVGEFNSSSLSASRNQFLLSKLDCFVFRQHDVIPKNSKEDSYKVYPPNAAMPISRSASRIRLFSLTSSAAGSLPKVFVS